jgi:hypothetical protein
MQQKNKAIIIAILLTAFLVGSIVYGLMMSSHTFTNTVQIKGINLQVLQWISDTTPPTTLVTAHDWSKVERGQTVYYEFVCLKNIGTENVTLAFNTDLNPDYGSVTWYIEYYEQSTSSWKWKNWEQAITDKVPYVPGHVDNPVRPNQLIGMRTSSPSDLAIGRIRIALTITNNAPIAETLTFNITVTGTEKV